MQGVSLWRTVASICALPLRLIDWGLRDYQVNDQLGLEETPEAFVSNLVAVMREVWRVLKPWGVLFLNLGDSYASGGNSGKGEKRNPSSKLHASSSDPSLNCQRRSPVPPGLKPKDLVGIPWRVAFALQADGWYLRSDIIWSKPNPMPESVTDRPTKAHEYLFLLSKQKKYYYDADAVREANSDKWTPSTMTWEKRKSLGQYKDGNQRHISTKDGGQYSIRSPGGLGHNPSGRNRRTVWTIPTRPYKGAHFATFPPALVEPCIKAGTSERGNCPECGKPWERVVRREETEARKTQTVKGGIYSTKGTFSEKRYDFGIKHTTLGWRPTCDCCVKALKAQGKHTIADINQWNADNPPVPAVVLDPFAGSGTSLLVARQLGRNAIGLDLSFDYLRNQARKRLSLDKLAAHGQAKQVDATWQNTPLFAEVENG